MRSERETRQALGALAIHARPHRRWLLHGVLAALGVVLFRLTLPWPLRGALEVAFLDAGGAAGPVARFLPAGGDPLLWFAALYLVLALGGGACEMAQRISLARFSAQTVHDLRAAAVQAVARGQRVHGAPADLVARITSDSTRIKAGLFGILVHGLQSGLLFAGVCAVLLCLSLSLGLIFLGAGVAVLGIGLLAALPVAAAGRKGRRKEGEYAHAVMEGLERGTLLARPRETHLASVRKEATTTKLIGVSSLLVHATMAVAVGLALWVGVAEVRAGTLAPGSLFIFVAYATTVHRSMVRMGRQMARGGKVLASIERLAVLLGRPQAEGRGSASAREPAPLHREIRLEGVKLPSLRGRRGMARLRNVSLAIRAGSRVAVLGGAGSGKSSLLGLLAGVERPRRGRVFWDDEDLTQNVTALQQRAARLPQEPVFTPEQVWVVLGLEGPGALGPPEEETLRRVGAWRVIRSFPRGLEESVGSPRLSRNESRLLCLGGLLLADRSPLWVLDLPLEGVGGKKARRRLDEILRRAGKRTVVVALSRAVGLESFDRVLWLRRGRLQFDGTPADWKGRRSLAPRPR